VVVEDYNNRPHGSLLGHTPNEVYPDNYRDEKTDLPIDFQKARENRRRFKRNFCCINLT
jgi:hypothetical protein